MHPTTRRRAVLATAAVFLTAALPAFTAEAAPEQRTSLHQEILFKAKPQRVYDALLDAKQFAAFTGLPAEISRDVGGPSTMFGGRILARNVELVPGVRIVQAWREASWDPGVYSLVKFELKEESGGTKLILDHTGFDPGGFVHLDPGWHERYWEPLKKFLGG